MLDAGWHSDSVTEAAGFAWSHDEVILQIHLAGLQAIHLWQNTQCLNQSASFEELLAPLCVWRPVSKTAVALKQPVLQVSDFTHSHQYLVLPFSNKLRNTVTEQQTVVLKHRFRPMTTLTVDKCANILTWRRSQFHTVPLRTHQAYMKHTSRSETDWCCFLVLLRHAGIGSRTFTSGSDWIEDR